MFLRVSANQTGSRFLGHVVFCFPSEYKPPLTQCLAKIVDATEKKKIGKYEITGILGRGGMGVVYRAEDKRIGRQVAIKTLTEGFSGQPEMLERFYREAQAGILQHPNIVIVYDLGDEDGMPFIVMEYVDGDPLDKLISSGRQLPLLEKLSIIEQVCAALGYAHQRGVVHRDIKPANVIVQPDGHAKIVDFGIARVQSSGAEGGLTRTGNVIGTIHYIAPERLKGLPFDGRSDIFSTGVMLYLLLTGQLPFAGEDMAVLQKLVNEPAPPLEEFPLHLPAGTGRNPRPRSRQRPFDSAMPRPKILPPTCMRLSEELEERTGLRIVRRCRAPDR